MFTSALGETTSTSGFAPARWRRDVALASGVVASVRFIHIRCIYFLLQKYPHRCGICFYVRKDEDVLYKGLAGSDSLRITSSTSEFADGCSAYNGTSLSKLPVLLTYLLTYSMEQRPS